EIVSLDQSWKREPLTCDRLQREPQLALAPPVHAIAHNGFEQEAAFIADQILAMRCEQPGLELKHISVLYRGHYNRKEVVAELTRRGIPVRVKGADLFGTPELRDALAVLRILDATHPVALVRVSALAKFMVDPERFRTELALCREGISAELA